MSRREQLDKPTFKGVKCRKRSYAAQKAAFNRAIRRAAKRDPENAPGYRQFSGWFWSVLFCLLLCGCLKPVVPPAPEPDVPVVDATVDGVAEVFRVLYRQTYIDAAAKLRSGAWKTDREYLDGHRGLIRAAVEASGQPLSERQQREATPFTPDGMAAWLETVAREGMPE